MVFIDIPSILIICGPPKLGKSWCIKYLIYSLFEKRKIDFCYVFTGTAFNNNYSFLPKKCVTSKYSLEKLKMIVSNQIKLNKNGKKELLLIFDDIMGLNFDSPVWRALVSEYRHYNITLIFSVQYIKGVTTPIFRECCRYVIAFKTTSKQSVEALYEAFMNEFDNWRKCAKFIRDNTAKKYHFLFIDRYADENLKYKVLKCPENIPNYNIKF